MRLITKVTKGIYSAAVRYNSSLREYVVKFYVDSVHQVDADYFTDSKEDAVGTAEYQINSMKEKDYV